MKKLWIFFVAVAVLGAYTYRESAALPESHDTPYVTVGQVPVPADDSTLVQRIILWGDAGESQFEPLQPSLRMARELAARAPTRTTMLALGDNIYYYGFPVLEDGQAAYDDEQREDISHLEAQLRVARDSGARLVMVPGNHDWYAGQVDDQARFIAEYADRNGAPVSLNPWVAGDEPWPQMLHLDGVSLLLLDSQWMLSADEAKLQKIAAYLEQLLGTVPADNILIAAAHHPIETMGPHARFYTNLVYKAAIAVIEMIWGNDQDIDHPSYARYIEMLNAVFANHGGRSIFAAGHDHSLQVFGASGQPAPQYRLVSGAANSSKVSGVGHNDNTLFAVAREGFMAVERYQQGTWIRVWTIDGAEHVFAYRLW